MLELEKLKDKYIKYSEEITEDTFNKILDRAKEFAKEICPDLKTYRSFDDNSFDSFRFNKFFRFSGSTCSYGVDNNSQDAEEIKVSDILGEEAKFEVGKWYSFYWNWNSGYNCIGKVCQVNTYEKTVIKFDNYTSNNSPGKLFTDGRTIYLAEIENIKELNLEEIQQYLPDDHPDKIVKEFTLPAKWCIKVDENKKPVEVFKWRISSVDGGNKGGWNDKGFINNKKHHDYIKLEGYTEITLDQFKQYVLRELTEEFKVGDYVISLIDTSYGRNKGDLLLITGEDSYTIIAINKTELFSDTIASDEVAKSLRKATPEEIALVVKPKSKEFDRNWYVKVSSQAEWLMLCDYLEKMGEKVSRTDKVDFSGKGSWPYVIFNKTWQLKKEIPSLPQKQLSDILPDYSKVDRNVYYEVETQEQYNEILDWLEGNGEQVFKCYNVVGLWRYVCFENGEWSLNRKVESQLSKAEFQFKGKSEKQPIKTGGGLRDLILQNQYQYEYKTIDSSSVWETLMNPPTQNSTINLKQEPIKLLSFEEDDVVLFKTNSVKISNKQLIIND